MTSSTQGVPRRLPRTKIVATLGPASGAPQQIRALIRAGVSVFRLNFSHGNHDQHDRLIRKVRKASSDEDRPVAILADLQGPRLRIGALQGGEPIHLKRGEPLTLIGDPSLVGEPGRVGCTYASLAQEVQAGERILLDDGNLELRVTEVQGNEVQTRVVYGGLLRQQKGLNLPGTQVKTPSLMKKDLDDLAFAVDHDVDFVALSFVRSAANVEDLRQRIGRLGGDAEVISKIERPEAVKDIDAIVAASDGVMVARGDLGVELGPAAVPALQKSIIEKCIAQAKPVITATQMLESMTTNARPTRAEASDVANAVYDGTSALMLSAETASGRQPVLAVQTMIRIARATEKDILKKGPHPQYRQSAHDRRRRRLTISEATVTAAVRAAMETGARALVVFTESGRTAKLVARERMPMRILACTPHPDTFRRLNLQWGVTPVRNKRARSLPALRDEAIRQIVALRQVRPGDRVVFIAGQVATSGATNTLQIVDIEE